MTLRPTISALLPVLASRLKPGDLIWEPCFGLGNIASVLESAGYNVVGTDLFTPDGKGGFTINPEQSFISYDYKGKSYEKCPVPEGVKAIVTNPPFNEKLAFITRFYELGIPVYCLLPVETLGAKGCNEQFNAHGGVELFFLSGKAATKFHKVSEGRDVDVGACAWFGFNTRVAGEENSHFFI